MKQQFSEIGQLGAQDSNSLNKGNKLSKFHLHHHLLLEKVFRLHQREETPMEPGVSWS
jgi:hypothetical protein